MYHVEKNNMDMYTENRELLRKIIWRHLSLRIEYMGNSNTGKPYVC